MGSITALPHADPKSVAKDGNGCFEGVEVAEPCPRSDDKTSLVRGLVRRWRVTRSYKPLITPGSSTLATPSFSLASVDLALFDYLALFEIQGL